MTYKDSIAAITRRNIQPPFMPPIVNAGIPNGGAAAGVATVGLFFVAAWALGGGGRKLRRSM